MKTADNIPYNEIGVISNDFHLCTKKGEVMLLDI